MRYIHNLHTTLDDIRIGEKVVIGHVQRGVSHELLRHARAGAFSIFLSEEMLIEAQRVLLDEGKIIADGNLR
jgi:hypothetical protein